MDHWTHVVIEAYCLYDVHCGNDKHLYSFGNGGKVPNPHYDPTFVIPELPNFCMGVGNPCFNCLSKGCDHFAYCEARDVTVMMGDDKDD
jgi:hypothetical protein